MLRDSEISTTPKSTIWNDTSTSHRVGGCGRGCAAKGTCGENEKQHTHGGPSPVQHLLEEILYGCGFVDDRTEAHSARRTVTVIWLPQNVARDGECVLGVTNLLATATSRKWPHNETPPEAD